MTSQPGKQPNTIHKLHNISISKLNNRIYNIRKIFFLKNEEIVPEPLLNNQN